jgi:hypothetical protein
MASCLFSCNSENAWLWRHKVAAFAKRHGLADLDGMRRTFGRRWAYQRCQEILAEPLEGIVFPSESAAMKALDTDMLMARYKAQQIIGARPVTRTVLDQGESFNGWPIWAARHPQLEERRTMPASFGLPAVGHAKEGEQVASTPLSPEMVAAGEERARELRLFAARLEVVNGHVVRFIGQSSIENKR